MFGFATGFWKGFWAPLRALQMILTSPKLLALVAIPLAVNLVLYALFFHYGAHVLTGWVDAFTAQLGHQLPGWALTLSAWTLRLLSWLVLALLAALSFAFVGGLIAAPFNDHLSKAAYRLRIRETGATHHDPKPWLERSLKQTLLLELKRLLILLLGAVAIALVGLVPLLQIPALLFGALLVSFEYFGYPIAQRSSSLGPVVWFTFRHPAVSLGFGAFLLLMMALPFASLVYIPLAVVGGTTLYADLMKAAANTHKKT